MALNDEEKLQGFANEALGEAEALSSKMLHEIELEKKQKLDLGENKILSEAYSFIQNELEKIRRNYSQDLSRHTMEQRKKFLLYRENITQQVFAASRKMIEIFTNTPEYKNYLLSLCKNALDKQTESFTIFISQEDAKYKDDILVELDKMVNETSRQYDTTPVFTLLVDKNIKLGGARFYSFTNGILINETLDENLFRQGDYFTMLLGPILNDMEKD